jgi:hypothetical protein
MALHSKWLHQVLKPTCFRISLKSTSFWLERGHVVPMLTTYNNVCTHLQTCVLPPLFCIYPLQLAVHLSSTLTPPPQHTFSICILHNLLSAFTPSSPLHCYTHPSLHLLLSFHFTIAVPIHLAGFPCTNSSAGHDCGFFEPTAVPSTAVFLLHSRQRKAQLWFI